MESGIKELILRRKTSKPANFSEKIPDPALIRELIEVGRHAPNHHRTEPARFYLLDQERKLQKSGLSKYFQHVEVLSDKKEKNYSDLLTHLQIEVDEFVMIGNSLKSDVLPLLNIGAKAIHIPFHTTWAHEEVSEKEIDKDHHYLKIERLTQLKTLF